MARKANKSGGGAKTNANGLKFEQVTSLNDALKKIKFNVVDHEVYKGKKLVGYSVPKHNFYKKFLVPNSIDYKKYNSKKWLTDECFVNILNQTVYIIEKKFQESSGSVDEKLPNFDFKIKEYEKLCKPIGYKVEYIYVLNDWFKNKQYKDVLEYIEKHNIEYNFNEIPLKSLGL